MSRRKRVMLRGPFLTLDEQAGLWRGKVHSGADFTVTHALLYQSFEETLTTFLRFSASGRTLDEYMRLAWEFARCCSHWSHKIGRVSGVESYEPPASVPPAPSLYERLQGMIA